MDRFRYWRSTPILKPFWDDDGPEHRLDVHASTSRHHFKKVERWVVEREKHSLHYYNTPVQFRSYYKMGLCKLIPSVNRPACIRIIPEGIPSTPLLTPCMLRKK